jgi:integrase
VTPRLTLEAIGQVVAALPAPTTAAAARLRLIAAGLRTAEVAAIRPDDWDKAAGTLRIPGRQGGRPRTVRLRPYAVEALQALETLAAWGAFSTLALGEELRAIASAAGLPGRELRLYDVRGRA